MSDYFSGPVTGSAPRPAPSLPPPGTWGPAQPSGWGPPPGGGCPRLPPPPPPSRGTNVIVVVASVLGGLFVLGVVAAIAVPAFLSQRAKAQAQATSVSLPAEISGIPRMQDAKGAELEAQLAGSALPGQQVNGVYGQPGLPQVAVTITHASLSANDQRGFLAGAERGLTSRSTLTFADVDPGSLGGLMRCATGDFTVCAFADAGAAGFIMLLSPSIGDLDQARAAREAVEHRD